MTIVQGIGMLIATFKQYAGKDGDACTLSREELKTLVTTEMKGLIEASDPAAFDKLMNDLDVNNDNTVDFKEYMTFIACLTMICHDYFTK